MFQCVEVIGIPDQYEIKYHEKYKVNIYFANVWVISTMSGSAISDLINAGIRVEFHK